MSGTTPAAHSGATFEKVADAPAVTAPAATPPAAVAATTPGAVPVVAPVVVAAVDPAKVEPIGNVVADPAAAADPAKVVDPLKPDPAKAAEPLKAEDYKITYPAEVPEGAKDPLIASFLPEAAKLGLSNEQVQALINTVGPALRDQQNTAFEGMQRQWQTDWKSDAKIGGANFDTTVARIRGAVTTFANDAAHVAQINQALVITGAGNNPAIMGLINNMATRLAEGKPVSGNTAVTAAQKSPGDTLYNHPTSQPGASAQRGTG